MTTVEELLGSVSEQEQGKNTFDKEEYRARKAAEREELFTLADTAALEICTSEVKFREYLDVQAKFLLYTATNALLITAQMPEATMLRSYDDWKGIGNCVRRGEKSRVKILISGKPYDRGDGSKGTSWDVKRVYDISQTASADEVRPDTKLDPIYLMRLILERPPVKIIPSESLPAGMSAYFASEAGTILVKRNLYAEDVLPEMLTEIAHADIAFGDDEYTREGAADIALCAAYVVARRYGINTSHFTLSGVASRLSGNTSGSREIRGVLSDIRNTANKIAYRIAKAREKQSQSNERSTPESRSEGGR